jgi:2-succinyl-5-enolpyruvyl-6-hydroxy-3-cyclohexene-1-carboxylate synthase
MLEYRRAHRDERRNVVDVPGRVRRARVSTETLATIMSAVGVVVTLGTSMFVGAAWMVRRIDAVDEKLSTRIDAVEERLGTRIDGVEEKLSTRIDAVAADVTDLKISVARLEGPPRHLLTAGRG